MNTTCRTLRQRAAVLGAHAVLDDLDDQRSQEHLATCDGCRRAVAALARLDEALGDLERPDVADTVVESLLKRVAEEPIEAERAGGRLLQRASGLGKFFRGPLFTPVVKRSLATVALATVGLAIGVQLWDSEQKLLVGDGFALAESGAADRADTEANAKLSALGYLADARRRLDAVSDAVPEPEPIIEKIVVTSEAPELMTEESVIFNVPEPPPATDSTLTFLDERERADLMAWANSKKGLVDRDEDTGFEDAGADIFGRRIAGGKADLNAPPGIGSNLVRDFLASRARIEGLTYQEPSGYWSNTYVPGDPDLRLLEARLAGQDSASLQALTDHPLRLHDAARPPSYPFDPPRSAAMALYVDSDRSGLSGPGRMLIQVGLRATDRHAVQRSSLDLAVVVDLLAIPEAKYQDALRALLRALVAAAEPGDRFHLFFAGREVTPIAPTGFRHGPVSVALDDALAAPAAPAAPATGDHDLTAVLQAASSALQGAEAADLGTSALLLITGRQDLDAFEDWAHQTAVAGTPVSVVGLGDGLDREALIGLALAGQGRVRHLLRPADAAGIVAREIAAVSRVVARALRLRIRLAPGVELVEVIGAERLDLAAAMRVREAEQSIDQRLARDLGIAADRGEDEDGIQIVIPAFYAGDSHVVLLDVVAPGPGRVADVALRYKDLVRSKNGTARARLKLRKSETRRHAAGRQGQRSVLKSLLAFELRAELAAAADDLNYGRMADERLRRMQQLLRAFQALDAGWASDRDISHDVAMIGDYLLALAASASDDDSAYYELMHSLRLASGRKLLRMPAAAGTD